MRPITKPQLTAIHTLLAKVGMGDKDTKGQVISSFTGGRTESSRAMTMDEAKELTSHLMSLDPEVKGAEKMRKKIISLAHEMGWKLPSSKIDMDRLNNWSKKYGYLHKKLDAYSYKELPALVTQFEGVYKGFIKKG